MDALADQVPASPPSSPAPNGAGANLIDFSDVPVVPREIAQLVPPEPSEVRTSMYVCWICTDFSSV